MIPAGRSAAPSPRVEAMGTMLYRQPDGSATLVRFIGHEVDAPGGRLRVYDSRRQLVGTAAMLKRNEVLYGELWLPVDGIARLSTQLEAPGLRGVIRNTHEVRPGHRWTVHVATPVDPAELGRVLYELPVVRSAVQASLYRRVHAATNPLRLGENLHFADHLPFLRSGSEAFGLQRRFGIPVSPAVHFSGDDAPPETIRLALINAGVRVVGMERAGGEPYEWWRSANDENPLVVAVPPGGTSSNLAFAAGGAAMLQRIEQWLSESALFLSPTYEPRVALVFHDTALDDLPRVVAGAAEWNGIYAYPNIVFGQVDDLRDVVVGTRGTGIPIADSPFPRSKRAPLADARTVVRQREAAESERAHQMITALAGTVSPDEPLLRAFGESLDTNLPGTIVFNPSPFPRTDLIRLEDGSEQLVTDVPELGYAYFPHVSAAPRAWASAGAATTLDTAVTRVNLDERTGSITSLSRVSDGLELVSANSAGLNTLSGARLEASERLRLPRVAERLVTVRRLGNGETVTVTITAYQHLPWIDIENVTDTTTRSAITNAFFFDLKEPSVRWEVPGGYEEADAPVENLAHLRWLRVTTDDAGVLFRAFDEPSVSVSTEGRVMMRSPRGRARYRIGVEPGGAGSTAPWRFGWQTVPMQTAPVTGSGRGTLPRFGSILNIDRGGVLALGMKPADDGRGLILFLQEILGTPRSVSIRPGLVTFERASLVDFLERDSGSELAFTNDGIRVPLSAWGVAAVRLQDVALSRE